MKVLLTGASSFTGLWFAEALAAKGASVVAPLRGTQTDYTGMRAERVRRLSAVAEIVPACGFGTPRFLTLIAETPFDLLCHHGARVGDYRSPDFDVSGAVAENTLNLPLVLQQLAMRGLKAVITTGSVFEQDEGEGEKPLRAFSPYGVSKGLTWQAMRDACGQIGVALHKFVIANPFGPYEEPRFVDYLVKTWAQGKIAQVRTPRYVRDNIHVDLLALAYARYAGEAAAGRAADHFGPRGYVESQGAFAERVAAQLRPRLERACALEMMEQTAFPEPVTRVNRDVVASGLNWDETAAWDRLAEHYRRVYP